MVLRISYLSFICLVFVLLSCNFLNTPSEGVPKIAVDISRKNLWGDSIRVLITEKRDTIWNIKLRSVEKWEKIENINQWAVDTNNMGADGDVTAEDICLFNFGSLRNKNIKKTFFYPSKSVSDQWIVDLIKSSKDDTLPFAMLLDTFFTGLPKKMIEKIEIDSIDLDNDNIKEIILGFEGGMSYRVSISLIFKKHFNGMWKIMDMLGPNFLGKIIKKTPQNLLCFSSSYARSDHAGQRQWFYKTIGPSNLEEVFVFAPYQEMFKNFKGSNYWEEVIGRIELFSKTKIITNFEYREYSGKRVRNVYKVKFIYHWSDTEHKFLNTEVGYGYPNIYDFRKWRNISK